MPRDPKGRKRPADVIGISVAPNFVFHVVVCRRSHRD